MFDAVNKFFTVNVMAKAAKAPYFKCFKFISQRNIVEDFIKNNADLEYIQKKLEDYMEVKRGVFPRFYFLSNDDLLEILANSDNKDVISLHLKTLFDGLVKLTFKDDSILKMHSKENEEVELTKPIRMKNGVENWLQAVQDEMKVTVQRKLRDGQKSYTEGGRKDWVLL
jgi:dynein heavy chain